MSSQPSSIHACRARCRSREAGRPLYTPAQKARRDEVERQLRALADTPQGAVRFLEEYAQVAPADVAEILRDWQAWLQRSNHPDLAEQLTARGR